MLRLDKVIKQWKESAALNDHINLYGFWNETAFLTKSGDVGMVLNVPGVDYESLDRSEQEYAVKRLEAALKAFGPGFHVSNRCSLGESPAQKARLRLFNS
jgi:type IV secretory pathway VirB4 component